MTIDGWICPACWKRNKASAGRCFMCKLPRGADPMVVKAQRTAVEQAARQPVAEAVPDTVVAIPALVFMVNAWLYRAESVLILVVSVLSIVVVPLMIVVGPLAAGIGWLMARLSNAVADGMRERRVWAFLVGFAFTGFQAGAFAFVMIVVARESPSGLASLPAWQLAFGVAVAAVNAIAAVCALFGLVLMAITPTPPAVPQVTEPHQ